MTIRNLWYLLKETVAAWQKDVAHQKAAALAYYTTFSMAPLLVLVITLAGVFGGREAAQSLVMGQIQDLIGVEGKQFIQDMIENAAMTSTGLTASIIGTVTLLLGAIGAFTQLQIALNRIWGVEAVAEKWTKSVKNFLTKRLLSFSMLVGIGFLLLVSLVVDAGLAALSEFVSGIPVVSEVLLKVLDTAVSLGMITLLFALIYKYIPDAQIGWRSVWLGALITAILFTIGKTLIGLYLGRSQIGSSFGAAGSLVLIMVWIYYSSQIVFFGAEFTQVFSKWRGERVKAEAHAVEKPKDD